MGAGDFALQRRFGGLRFKEMAGGPTDGRASWKAHAAAMR